MSPGLRKPIRRSQPVSLRYPRSSNKVPPSPPRPHRARSRHRRWSEEGYSSRHRKSNRPESRRCTAANSQLRLDSHRPPTWLFQLYTASTSSSTPAGRSLLAPQTTSALADRQVVFLHVPAPSVSELHTHPSIPASFLFSLPTAMANRSSRFYSSFFLLSRSTQHQYASTSHQSQTTYPSSSQHAAIWMRFDSTGHRQEGKVAIFKVAASSTPVPPVAAPMPGPVAPINPPSTVCDHANISNTHKHLTP